MRFSAVQEDGYGTGLKQDKKHYCPNSNDVDNSMMAATGETQPVGEDTAEDCSMIYNLPLLIANGFPTSLEIITVSELERFITFMVKCSMTQSPTPETKPVWWSNDIEFSIPIRRPQNSGNRWFDNLKKLVIRCYNYHRSEYLLRFCTTLAQYPREKLYYINNWNSTTSLFHKSTGKLLATFRNENMNYDKVAESPRKSLLAQNNVNASLSNKYKKSSQRSRNQPQPSSLVVIQPTKMEEIYLCDNCDAEFDTLDQMKDHEKTCGELIQTSNVSRPVTPYEVETDVELSQSLFMEYFHLRAADQLAKRSTSPLSLPSSSQPSTSTDIFETETTRSRRLRPTINLTRHPTIPFSSPAGLAMVKKSKGMTDVTQQERLDRIERYMNAPPLSKNSRPKWYDKDSPTCKWNVTYKPNKENLSQDNYVHQYTFGAVKRKSTLCLRSQLLYVACRPIYVYLEKLTEQQINDLKVNPWKYKCPTPKIPLKHHSRIVMRIGRTYVAGDKRKYYSKLRVIPVVKEKMAKYRNINNNNSNNNDNSNNRNKKCEATHTRHGRQSTTVITSSQQQLDQKNKTIILVDLCSSDEEDNTENNKRISLSDENCDPLNKKYDNSSRINCLKSLGLQSAARSLSNGISFVNDTFNERLRESILTDDNDKSNNNKCRKNSVIDNCKNFSPIFKPSP